MAFLAIKKKILADAGFTSVFGSWVKIGFDKIHVMNNQDLKHISIKELKKKVRDKEYE